MEKTPLTEFISQGLHKKIGFGSHLNPRAAISRVLRKPKYTKFKGYIYKISRNNTKYRRTLAIKNPQDFIAEVIKNNDINKVSMEVLEKIQEREMQPLIRCYQSGYDCQKCGHGFYESLLSEGGCKTHLLVKKMLIEGFCFCRYKENTHYPPNYKLYQFLIGERDDYGIH